jgi:hypothetical protein
MTESYIQIILLIIAGLILISTIDLQSKNRVRYVSATDKDWVIIRKLKHNKDKGNEILTTIELDFVPIIAWEYRPWDTKYGKASPTTIQDYVIKRIMTDQNKYPNIDCFIARGESVYTYDDGHEEAEFWDYLIENAMEGVAIEVRGNLPIDYRGIIKEAMNIPINKK